MNANVPFFIEVGVDLLVGYEINKDGPSGVQANAELTVTIATAIVNSGGDPSAALSAVEAALVSSTTDPAKQMALQAAIMFIANKASAINGLAAGGVTATLIAQALVSAAQEAVKVATKYLPKAA